MHPRTLQMMEESDRLSAEMEALKDRLQSQAAPPANPADDPVSIKAPFLPDPVRENIDWLRTNVRSLPQLPFGVRDAMVQEVLERMNITADPDGCWEWTGGFGILWPGLFQLEPAELTVYQLWVAPATGLDRIECFQGNPNCVQPAHLQIVGSFDYNEESA